VITVVPDYTTTNTVFAWISPTSMPSLNLTGDAVSPAQTLPFSFRFYGQDYTTVSVGANGLLSFDPQALPGSNTDLPNAATPNNLICPFWDDLTPPATGVRFGLTGVAPLRRAVVSWVGATAGSGPSAAHTFQAILEESTHNVVFQYLEVHPGSRNSSAAGQSASIGLEHRSGLVAARHSYNGSSPLTNGQAIRFVPSPAGGVTNPPPLAVTLVSPAWRNGQFTFSFTSQVGRVYHALAADRLNSTQWQTFGTFSGNGAVLTVTNPQPTGLQQFHRIEAQ